MKNQINIMKENKLPASWREYANTYKAKSAKELVSIMAPMGVLTQLLFLRDEYRMGWVPEWENVDQIKYTIGIDMKKCDTKTNEVANKMFAFQSAEIRDLFYKNFKSQLRQIQSLFK